MSVDTLVFTPQAIESPGDLATAKRTPGTTWVRAHDTSEAEREEIASVFNLHPLAMEDVVNDVRPKTEEFDEYTFVLIKAAELTRGETTFDEEIQEDSIGVFFGTDWVVSMARGSDDPVNRVWRAVESRDERLLERGPDFTAYRIIDVVVDEYFEVLDRIETQIESVEDEVLFSTEIETLEAINSVRRDLLSFRKIVWPAREALGVLSRGDTDYIQSSTEKYFRDIYDHLVQVVDLIETYRDLTIGARDIYLNTLSQSTNEVMKTLTVIATVFLPLTFVVGVYGMNFADSPFNMPELAWRLGYPAVMLGMTAVAGMMMWYFRKHDYL